jgi:hypothetical protein
MENNELQKTECKSCKSKNPLTKPNGMMLVGFYILFATCYGTVQIIKDLIEILSK